MQVNIQNLSGQLFPVLGSVPVNLQESREIAPSSDLVPRGPRQGPESAFGCHPPQMVLPCALGFVKDSEI